MNTNGHKSHTLNLDERKRLAAFVKANGGKTNVEKSIGISRMTFWRTMRRKTGVSPLLRSRLITLGIIEAH